jgi:hypothetical protein
MSNRHRSHYRGTADSSSPLLPPRVRRTPRILLSPAFTYSRASFSRMKLMQIRARSVAHKTTSVMRRNRVQR